MSNVLHFANRSFVRAQYSPMLPVALGRLLQLSLRRARPTSPQCCPSLLNLADIVAAGDENDDAGADCKQHPNDADHHTGARAAAAAAASPLSGSSRYVSRYTVRLAIRLGQF